MRRLGIDFGSKRVGLALTDESGEFAYPLAVLANDDKLLGRIKTISAHERVGEVVIGESFNFRRRQNPIMKSILKFKTRLEIITGLPVILEDETLTTKEANRLPGKPARSERSSARSGRDKMLDARAAAIILKGYLDRHR